MVEVGLGRSERASKPPVLVACLAALALLVQEHVLLVRLAHPLGRVVVVKASGHFGQALLVNVGEVHGAKAVHGRLVYFLEELGQHLVRPEALLRHVDEAVPAGDARGAEQRNLQVRFVGAHALALGQRLTGSGALVVKRVANVATDPSRMISAANFGPLPRGTMLRASWIIVGLSESHICVGRRNGSRCTLPSAGTESGATRPVHESGRCHENGPALGLFAAGSSLFVEFESSRARLRSDGAEADDAEAASSSADWAAERLIKPGALVSDAILREQPTLVSN
eukprot:CAMPEP_0182562722 /NCGR_PEP_ID=MMETSP1324-20130603/5024_1 /TAXON_ID=236786 /ORGANISM="Florenciella sp., Strain RCC1587" /LENGTH=282 /DNA_ID=CAMNT_0024775751 /DNA_START=203 /DNA_END=1052 /DNA_ORIENTATION=-